MHLLAIIAQQTVVSDGILYVLHVYILLFNEHNRAVSPKRKKESLRVFSVFVSVAVKRFARSEGII